MKLQQIVLEDFGPYAGTNSLDLHTDPDRPIILFGGINGAGKTTLFESIQICLHGRSALGDRVSEAEYKEKIRGKLHESGGEQATEAAITLRFEYGNLGETNSYEVTRSWRDRGKSIVEDLQIKRNGGSLTDLDEDQWEDFLKELIPPGVSQLFFFDGEKVQELASAIESGDEFTKSLFSLLGLDLVDRLDADLSLYLSQKLNESGHEEIGDELEEVHEEIDATETELKKTKVKKTDAQAELRELNEDIERLEEKLAKEGGAFARKRDDLKERREEITEEIEDVETEIQELAQGAYPFALAPDLCRRVQDRLTAEAEAETKQAAQQRVVDELASVDDVDELAADLDVDGETTATVVAHLRQRLTERLAVDDDDGYRLSREFSQNEREEMFDIVDRALEEIPQKMGVLSNRLETLTRERQAVEQNISRAPNQAVISPILEDVNELTEEKGKIKQTIDECNDRIEELEGSLSRLKNKREKLEEKSDSLEDVSDRADLASKTRNAVSAYKERLRQRKLERLEETLTDHYLSISNKSEFYEGVVIDQEEVEISVKTRHGTLKAQDQLSAGERQIFATAMLWALADISGRPLPFIIDTPLGRLDEEHRSKLVENFFPEASHQVLLFSTNTEISERYYELLADDLAAEYYLEYNEETGSTDIHSGYFHQDADEAVQEVNPVSTSSTGNSQGQIGRFSDE
ncbi:DNA sulfur modification protein DndD [Halogranum amylolyticum]|uniref:DNA sulfur modification protein DndD n=1 Tax=Halogranum amylolyticum TaxID=660520 RepID=A0A1H8W5P2_9EURY|nr:DNA sulfur modification protein DndD [Halogranum amylolyticum]SEP22975.1 DNA sulfur modification protein DndD [Halogranum amylolyticum]